MSIYEPAGKTDGNELRTAEADIKKSHMEIRNGPILHVHTHPSCGGQPSKWNKKNAAASRLARLSDSTSDHNAPCVLFFQSSTFAGNAEISGVMETPASNALRSSKWLATLSKAACNFSPQSSRVVKSCGQLRSSAITSCTNL